MKFFNTTFARWLTVTGLEYMPQPAGLLFVTLCDNGQAIAVTKDGSSLLTQSGSARLRVASYVRQTDVFT